MSTESSPSIEKPRAFEWFELTIALLLGCGAVGASLSGYESGLWNGKTTESFAKATALTTLASADEHKAMITNMHDVEIDLEAKKLLAEAAAETDDKKRRVDQELASSLYVHHLSDAAYKDLGLPEAAKQGKAEIPATTLTKVLDADLSEAYMHKVFAAAEADREKAQADFAVGSHASTQGDRFALVEVLFAVSLFISGTALVFKTRLRWLFAGVGFAALLGAAGYLISLEWM